MTESVKFALPTADQEDLEEALGFLWHRFENKRMSRVEILPILASSVSNKVFDRLLSLGFVVDDGTSLSLSDSGRGLALQVTRRHRLADRLLHDVLDVAPAAVDADVCRLEHILSPEVTDSICTLLGHPTEDPLGRPIPPGACCADGERRMEPLLSSLSRFRPGQEGQVAYLKLSSHPELHKLLSLGLAPGVRVHVTQTRPAFVIRIGDVELALDEETAQNIFVRKA